MEVKKKGQVPAGSTELSNFWPFDGSSRTDPGRWYVERLSAPSHSVSVENDLGPHVDLPDNLFNGPLVGAGGLAGAARCARPLGRVSAYPSRQPPIARVPSFSLIPFLAGSSSVLPSLARPPHAAATVLLLHLRAHWWQEGGKGSGVQRWRWLTWERGDRAGRWRKRRRCSGRCMKRWSVLHPRHLYVEQRSSGLSLIQLYLHLKRPYRF